MHTRMTLARHETSSRVGNGGECVAFGGSVVRGTPALFIESHFHSPSRPETESRVALYSAVSRRKRAASSGGIGFTWKPLLQSKPAGGSRRGVISRCQW